MVGVEKVPVGLESLPMTIDLSEQLLGPNKSNLDYIKRCTGAQVTLRGWRSGYLEHGTCQESLEPLHFRIEHPNIKILQKARQLAVDLIQSIQEELVESKQSPSHVQPPPVVSPPVLHQTHSAHQSQGIQKIIETKSAPQKLFENQQTQSNIFLNKQLTMPQSVPEQDSSHKIDWLPQILQQLQQEFQAQSDRQPPHLSTQELESLMQLMQHVQHTLQIQLEQQSSNQSQSLSYPSTAQETEQLIKLMHQLLQTLTAQSGITSQSVELSSGPSETPELYNLSQTVQKLLQEFKDQCNTSTTEQQIANVLEEIQQVLEDQPDISAEELEQLVDVMEQLPSVMETQPSTSVSELQYLTFLTRNLQVLLNHQTNVVDLKKITEIIKTQQQAFKAEPKSKRELKEFAYVLQNLLLFTNKLKWSLTVEGKDLIQVLSQLVKEVLEMSTDKPTEDLPIYKLGGTVVFKPTLDLHQGLKEPPPTPTGIKWSIGKSNENESSLQDADRTESHNSASTRKRKFNEFQKDESEEKGLTNEQSDQHEMEVDEEYFHQEMAYTDNVSKQNQEEYETQNDETPDSDTLKQSSVLLGDRDLRITLIPPSVDSLYASLAYLTLGPFSSITKLITAAKSLHQQTVQYIKDNKVLFFTDICKLYSKVFPDRKFYPARAFEDCCQYGAEPGHKTIYEPIFVISTMLNTPIIVLYEDGGKPLTVDPINSCDNKLPISILYSSDQTRFNPVDVFVTNLHHDQLSSNTSSEIPLSRVEHEDVSTLLSSSQFSVSPNVKSIPLCHKFVVAACNVNFIIITDCGRESVDDCLSKYDVDLAVIQGALNSNQNIVTKNYNWFSPAFIVSTKMQSGVSFLVRKSSKATFSNFHSYSPNLISATVSFNKATFSVIGCRFFSPESELYQEVVNHLTHALDSAPTSSQILLLGNFHAKIGWNDKMLAERPLVGNNLFYKISNTNGKLVKRLALQYGLRIVTTFSERNNDVKTIRQNQGFYKQYHILLQKPFEKAVSFTWWESLLIEPIAACHIYLEH